MIVISKAEAKAQGLNFFFEGRECPHGHVAERYVKTGICAECHRGRALRRSRSDPEKHRSQVKTWRRNNPEKHRDYQKNWYRQNNDKVLKQVRYRTYGLTEAQFNTVLEAQDNSCAGCLEPFTKVPQVDHCHQSSKVRGLLCGGCNRALAMAKDSPATLRRLADYLEH